MSELWEICAFARSSFSFSLPSSLSPPTLGSCRAVWKIWKLDACLIDPGLERLTLVGLALLSFPLPQPDLHPFYPHTLPSPPLRACNRRQVIGTRAICRAVWVSIAARGEGARRRRAQEEGLGNLRESCSHASSFTSLRSPPLSLSYLTSWRLTCSPVFAFDWG